jgi:anaphase-promoting complex subunit 2
MNEIQDLKSCMLRTNEKEELLRSLTRSISNRLLQPVASTDDILSLLVNIIGFGKEIKSIVSIEEAIFERVRDYLKNRADSVRVILQMILEQHDENEDGADVLTMLLTVHADTQVFVKEFQKILSERLLLLPDFNAENEIKDLEVLKKVFGENLLSMSEVMLKDVADSKRLDSQFAQSASLVIFF